MIYQSLACILISVSCGYPGAALALGEDCSVYTGGCAQDGFDIEGVRKHTIFYPVLVRSLPISERLLGVAGLRHHRRRRISRERGACLRLLSRLRSDGPALGRRVPGRGHL